MIKRTVLMALAAVILLLSSTASYAYQTNGMNSPTGVAPLPVADYGWVNPDGLGDNLYYGYYNVRGNINIFNIVNTSTTDGIKVRVVFREARSSAEILDFDVCLSKGDRWTAYLADTGQGGGIYSHALLDGDTITAPVIPTTGQAFKYGVNNKNSQLNGDAISMDDTREGYFEVVGLSAIPGYDKNSSNTGSCATDYSAATLPVNNCIRSATDCTGWGTTSNGRRVGTNLLGNNMIVELATSGTYSYNATALNSGRSGGVADSGLGNEYSIPGNGSWCFDTEIALNKEQIITPYDLISSLGGETEAIILFPTRRMCHHGVAAVSDYFDCTSFNSTTLECTAFCTKLVTKVWNEKEQFITNLEFSPSGSLCLPNELNVMKFGASNIWNSNVAQSVSVGTYSLGWASFDFGMNQAGQANHIRGPYENVVTGTGTYTTYSGLPIIAYTTQSYIGSAATYMVPAFARTNVTFSPNTLGYSSFTDYGSTAATTLVIP